MGGNNRPRQCSLRRLVTNITLRHIPWLLQCFAARPLPPSAHTQRLAAPRSALRFKPRTGGGGTATDAQLQLHSRSYFFSNSPVRWRFTKVVLPACEGGTWSSSSRGPFWWGRGDHRARRASPVPPSPTSTSLKEGTPSGVCWPGSACSRGRAVLKRLPTKLGGDRRPVRSTSAPGSLNSPSCCRR